MPRSSERSSGLRVALLAGTLALGVNSASAAERLDGFDRVYDRLAAVQEFKSVAISPDGRTAAYVQIRNTGQGAAEGTRLFLVDLDDPASRPRRIRAGATEGADEVAPEFSPDGRSCAFISDGGPGRKADLYIVDVAGGAPRRLTDLKGSLVRPRFSPDGRSLGFLFLEGAEGSGPLGPAPRAVGVVEEKIVEQRLMVVTLATGAVRAASPADLYIYEFDWSPDGRSVAATAAAGEGDANWWVARLVTIDLGTGKSTSLLAPTYQIAVPRWSPDGRSIAYIGGLMSDQGAVGGDVWVIPAGGGTPTNLTPGRPASPAWLSWLANGKLLVVESANASSSVVELDPATKSIAALWKAAETLSAGSGLGLASSRDGARSAVIRHSFRSPPEVWAGPVGRWTRLTNENNALRPVWSEAEDLRWKSGALEIQGWLLPPSTQSPSSPTSRSAASGEKSPLAVLVHGGPAGAFNAGWPGTMAGSLAARGFSVFLPNPRGSHVRGEEFTRGNVKDFGHGDLSDITTGIDEILRTHPVDAARVGIYGWSYGGYMVMWAVTQTPRFHSAVAGAGIANWESYSGQNRIDQWLLPYFGATVYLDPAVYARSSPIRFIRNVKTPTLVLQGERDSEVPAPQAFEFWHALKTLGVPTQLVIYPDEGHSFSSPAHKKDRVKRVVEWLERDFTSPR